MTTQPPPQQYPPPSPGAYPDGMPPPQSSAPVVMGVFSIVFALLCGCLNYGWMGAAANLEKAQELSAEEITSRLVTGVRIDTQETDPASGRTREEQRRISEEQARKFGNAIYGAVGRAVTLPEFGTMKTCAEAAMVLQLLLLVSGGLLAARVKVGRVLGIMACIGLVGTYVQGAGATAAVIDPFVQELAPVIEEQIDISGQTADSQEMLEVMDAIQDLGAQQASYVFGIVFCLYPLIAGLILIFSRGVRDGLGPPRHAQQPDSW